MLDLHFKLDQVQLNNRIVSVDALPMGINYMLYRDAVLNPDVQKRQKGSERLWVPAKSFSLWTGSIIAKVSLHRLRGFS